MNWITETFLKRYVKAVLDKLPANGAKTIIGVVLLILHELTKVYGGTPYGSILLWGINFLNGLGGSPDTVLNISLATILIGALHKALKLAGAEK